MKDDLGRRFKRDYEDALRLFLPRRAYVVIRIDGRGFHKFTEDLERPYCRALADALDRAALYLCQEMIGCRFAYGQSDEYSFLLTDFEREDSALWFDGNVQKIVSVSASLFTAAFNRAADSKKLAAFDSRVMVISQRAEVERYFLWRQLDASANRLNVLTLNRTLARLRTARASATGEKLASLNDLAADLITPPIRYSKPELQAHIAYLYTLTNATDQKIGRDAIERYKVLRKALDERIAQLNRILGADK